jgi:Flp pilus assembly pilin Flp
MFLRVAIWFHSAVRGEGGQDLIEYSLFAGLIAAALVVASMLALTGAVHGMGAGIGECIDWDGVTCAP